MEKRFALVTGATGFIASHLVPALVGEGWNVRATGRRPRPAGLGPEVDYVSADLVGGSGLDELYEGVSHVFHLAGASSSLSSQEEMERVNIEGTANLLAAAPSSGDLERFVHMSSTSVYGEEEQLPSPVPEEVEPHPSRGYGKAKWGAEKKVWEAGKDGLGVTVLRPVSVHGPGTVKLLASAILDVAIERFSGRETLEVPSPAVEQRLVHIDDLTAAAIHLSAHDAAVGRAFNVVSGRYPTSHEIAGLLAEEFGMDVVPSDDPDCGPSYEERRRLHGRMAAEGMDPSIILSPERFRFMRKANLNNRLSIDALLSTGFAMRHTDISAALAADVDWYRRHHWIL